MLGLRRFRCSPATALLLSAALAVLAPAQTTMPVPVDAVCIDPEGRPVAGVQFGDAWGFADGRWHSAFQCPDPVHPLHLVSDAEGRIAGTWILSPFATPLLGWNSDRSLVAFVHPTADPATHELRIQGPVPLTRAVTLRCAVRPTRPVDTVRLAIERRDPPDTSLGLPTTFSFSSDVPELDLPLPPGRYTLNAGAGFGQAPACTVVLEPGREVFDAGTFHVALPAFALTGEILPDWHVDEAHGIPLEDATLAHFRGKLLLVHFDDYGFPPRLDQATREALAALDEHPRREAFEVVLFGPMDDRLAGLPERPPNPEFDRLFPKPAPGKPRIESLYPVLTDRSGETERLYGVSFGTALVDRDGRLVRHGAFAEAHAELLRRLGEK